MKCAHPKLYTFLEKAGATSKFYGISIQPCTEGKPMKHLVFSDKRLMSAVKMLIPKLCENFEIHDDNGVICVPANLSNMRLEALMREAKASLGRCNS